MYDKSQHVMRLQPLISSLDLLQILHHAHEPCSVVVPSLLTLYSLHLAGPEVSMLVDLNKFLNFVDDHVESFLREFCTYFRPHTLIKTKIAQEHTKVADCDTRMSFFQRISLELS